MNYEMYKVLCLKCVVPLETSSAKLSVYICLYKYVELFENHVYIYHIIYVVSIYILATSIISFQNRPNIDRRSCL